MAQVTWVFAGLDIGGADERFEVGQGKRAEKARLGSITQCKRRQVLPLVVVPSRRGGQRSALSSRGRRE